MGLTGNLITKADTNSPPVTCEQITISPSRSSAFHKVHDGLPLNNHISCKGITLIAY